MLKIERVMIIFMMMIGLHTLGVVASLYQYGSWAAGIVVSTSIYSIVLHDPKKVLSHKH